MIAVLGTGELGSCSPQVLYFLSKQQKKPQTQPQLITVLRCPGAASGPEAAVGCGHLSLPSALKMLQASEPPGHQGRVQAACSRCQL